MKYLIEMPVDGPDSPPATVGVQIEQPADGIIDVSRRPGQVVARAERSLGEMLGIVRPVAESFLESLVGMTDTPDDIGLEFGLSLSADANLVVATTAAQGNFKVTLTWHRSPTAASDAKNRPAPPRKNP